MINVVKNINIDIIGCNLIIVEIENNIIIFEDTNLYEIKIYNLKEDRNENN